MSNATDKPAPDPSLDALKDAVRRSPRDVRAHLAYAAILRKAGRFEEALQSTYNAIKVKPDDPAAHAFLAELLTATGKNDKAVKAWTDALRLDPTQGSWWRKLGELHGSAGRLNEARNAFEYAARLDPRHPDSWIGLGRTHEYAGRFAEAETAYRQAVKLAHSSPVAAHRLAAAIGKQNRFQESLNWLKRAVELDPNAADAWRNLGMIYSNLRSFDEAKSAYRQAIQRDPRNTSTIAQLARTFVQLGRLDDAIETYDHALAVNPDDAAAKGQRAIALLLKGDLARGFADYESRTSVPDFPGGKRHISVRPWEGQNVIFKTVVLYAEQGLGDTIQFLRYVPYVLNKGARVVIEIQDESLRRVTQSVPGISKEDVIIRGQAWPAADFCRPLMSLPRLCGTTLETIQEQSSPPYLQLDDETREQWSTLIGPPDGRLKIGLAWAGSPKHPENAWRSIAPEHLAPLAAVPNVAWYNLQKNFQSFASHPLVLIDLMDRATDFYDTAALIDQLDMVITVDTAIAHLAGALGKTVWTLLPQRPDWRWMFQREDSPWYPTMRLIRQQTEGQWPEVLERVAEFLRALPQPA
ncbi:MAG: tetratricopeptide repeat protein [Phycisphaerales bacterium]|nr:tetratricopeptide repeat protein [Phycisphaerales bacterium]